MNCVVIDEKETLVDNTLLHIPSVDNTVLTLCGWVDVPNHIEEGRPTCPECLRVVRYCKSLKIPLKAKDK